MLLNTAAFVIIMAGIMSAKSLIIPFLLAAFLAVICGPPLYWLRTRGVPPFLTIILLVLILIAVEMVVARLVGSSLADFSRNLPLYQSRLKEILAGGIIWLQGHGIEVTDDVIVSQFDPGKIMGLAANTLNRMGALLTNTFMIIVTLVFILLEAAGFPDKLRAIAGDRNASLEEYAAITRGVNRYLVIKTSTSLATGILVAVALQIIGVDFAGMWGLVAFLFNFVPTIGSILAAIPAVLVALVQLGPGPAVTTIVCYLVINLIISNILEPRIMGTGVGLSPMVIFISMAFWGWILGPVGMLLSVPLTMILKIALQSDADTRWFAVLLGSNREAKRILHRWGKGSAKE